MLEGNSPESEPGAPAPAVSTAPDKTRVSLTVPPKVKKAIETLATLGKTDNADVLLNRTITQVLDEYDRLKELFSA